eukprot:1197863-Alexandrium_andersonii.AAC.1
MPREGSTFMVLCTEPVIDRRHTKHETTKSDQRAPCCTHDPEAVGIGPRAATAHAAYAARVALV